MTYWFICLRFMHHGVPSPYGLKDMRQQWMPHDKSLYGFTNLQKDVWKKFFSWNKMSYYVLFISINHSLLNLSLWDNLSNSGFFNSFFVSKPIIPVAPVHGAMQHKIKFILNTTEITKDIKMLVFGNSLN